MEKKGYCDAVLSCVRWATQAERLAIRAELEGHLEDHREMLLELGYSRELAEERTLTAMGDPVEVGKALDRAYPLRWLVLSRTAGVLLAVVMAFLVLSLPLPLRLHIGQNLQARLSPRSATPAWVERINLDTDIRLSIGSDVLYIFGTGTKKLTAGQGEADILLCWYDQSPLGCVSNLCVTFEDCRGAVCTGGAGSTSSSGASFQDWKGEVRWGDPYVTAVCQRYGQRYTVLVPLKWEEES